VLLWCLVHVSDRRGKNNRPQRGWRWGWCVVGRLEGRVALVTGAARGLGAAIARGLAAEGARVICADVLESSEVAMSLSGDLRSDSSGAMVLDVTDPRDVESCVARVVGDYGSLDILVNNAGVGQPILEVLDTSDETLERVLAVNVKGVFYCSRAAGRVMRAQGRGRIVNIASQAGKIGLRGWGVYCASKFAVVGLTETLALELGKDNVTVNCVCPGTIATEMTLAAFGERALQSGLDRDDMLRSAADSFALHRLGTPEDVAAAVCWLASDDASFTTGASLNVTGGEQIFF
jgi:NAD(P)-dependent dehydrogenase (short-subunit alcohol dehydrogenase family)